jgi:hypothetical protein
MGAGRKWNPTPSYIQQLTGQSANGHPECRRRVALSGPGRQHSHRYGGHFMPLLVVPSDERLNAMSNFTCLCVGDSQKFYMYLKTLLGPLLFRLIFSDRSWRRIRETSVEFEAFPSC